MLNFGDELRAGETSAPTVEAKTAVDGPASASRTWAPDPPWFVNDVPFDLEDPGNWQNNIPFVTMNGVDEVATTTDDDFYSRVSQPFSVGLWLRRHTVGEAVYLFAKENLTISSEDAEWRLHIKGDGRVQMVLGDTSAAPTNGLMFRPSITSVAVDEWTFVVASVNATQTATTDINLYVNGALSNGSGTKQSGFVAMEAGATDPRLGYALGPFGAEDFFDGVILGGLLGPFFVHKESSAAEVQALYYVGAQSLGSGF
jgi:hypothetical protein